MDRFLFSGLYGYKNHLKLNMKVLQIATHFGTTSVYNNLFSRLNEMGMSLFYIVSGRKHDYSVLGGKYKSTPHIPLLYKFFSSLKAKIYFKELFTQATAWEGVNVIHAHTVLSDGYLGMYVKQQMLPEAKLIVTVRSTDIKYRYRLLPWERPAFKRVLDAADIITVLSPAYRDKLLRIKSDWADKVEIVPNGLQDNLSIDVKVSSLNSSMDFLFVGRIIPRKNLHNVLRAFKRIKRDKTNVGALYIIGDGGKKWYRGIVRFLAKSIPEVYFLGKLSQEETFGNMAKCKTLVVPSYSETFGLVYLEGLAHNMTVIGSEGEGVAGYFTEPQGFYAANPRSVKSIYRCLDQAVNMNSRDAVDLSNFSWKGVTESYAKLY